ncbi:MAG TPA: gluconolactonase [Dehalococcoidia bacterium]|nr:gluconolactonase [Dehalococcoidia bacterium]
MPIQQFSDKLSDILDVSQEIITIGVGYGGDYGPAEGPLWWQESSSLLFSDIHNSNRMSWSFGETPKIIKTGTNQANGLTRDLQGRLLVCEQALNRVIRIELDGSTTVIASIFQGKPLNRTNDVVVKSDGSIYFTDPFNRRNLSNETTMDFAGVYRVSPDLGTMTLLVSDFVHPNGLAFSPDESLLYVNDSRKAIIRSFELNPDGTLARGTDRVFTDVSGAAPGVADGMKVDIHGNVYCGGAGGLWIIDSSGVLLGIIDHGEDSTSNLAFGGDNWDVLFITTGTTVCSVSLKVSGIKVPVV